MTFFEIVLTAISLSLDAVAIAIAASTLTRISQNDSYKIALFFGFFQFIMPLIGWLLSSTISGFASTYGHIIGFVLLGIVGLKMLYEATQKESAEDKKNERHLTESATLTIMAVATSIDALIVGATFSFIDVNIPLAVSVIGIVTFVLSLFAVQFGKRIHAFVGREIELFGGLVLIGLAIKTLIT